MEGVEMGQRGRLERERGMNGGRGAPTILWKRTAQKTRATDLFVNFVREDGHPFSSG
jgi:hypothetical protein